MKSNTKINKMFHIGTILLILSTGGLFAIQSALGDTVTPTAPVAKGSGQWEIDLNVSNNGANTQPIYDLHVTVTGANIIKLSGQWRKTLTNAQNGFWDTYQHDGKSIPDGSSSTAQKLGFDIRTDGPRYRVDWFTTNKTGNIVGDGNFTVP